MSGRPQAHPAKGRGARHVVVRVLRWVGMIFGGLVGLIVVAALVAVVAINTPFGRSFVVREVNATLKPSFQGRINVEQLGSVGLSGVSGVNATVYDPSGKPALVVRNAHVGLATLAAAKSALLDKSGPLTVTLSSVDVDAIDVRLDTDPKGQLDLLDAFAPAKPSPPPDPHARGFRLIVPRIALRHVAAHGTMAGAPPIDADVDDVGASFDMAPDVLSADVDRLKLTARRIANGADVSGALKAHVRKPTDLNALVASATWAGAVGGISHSLRATVDHGKIDAVVDAPAFAPDNVRSLWPASTLTAAGSAHAEAHGTLPNVDLGLHAGLGAAGLDVQGQVVVADDKSARLTIDAHDLDVRQFAPTSPPSKLGMRGQVTGSQAKGGAIDGDVALTFLGGSVGANAIPRAEIRAHAKGPSAADVRAHADIVIEEPAAPTHVMVDYDEKGGPEAKGSVLATFEAKVDDFEKVQELKHALAGRAQVTGEAAVDLGAMSMTAKAHALASAIAAGTTRVEGAELEATAQGHVAAPRLEATLRARDIRAAGLRFTNADVTASGAVTNPRVTVSVRGPDTPDVEGAATVKTGAEVGATAVKIALSRAGERAVVTADDVGTTPGRIHVEGARIQGLGSDATIAFASSPAGLRLKARSDGLDLGRIARLAHTEQTIKAGKVLFDADVDVARDRATGGGSVDIVGAVTDQAPSLSAHAEVAMQGRRFRGKLHTDAGEVGLIDVDVQKLEVPGAGPLTLQALQNAFGYAGIQGHLDLAKMIALIPPPSRPFSEAQGILTLSGHVARDDAQDVTPDVVLTLGTKGLVLSGPIKRARDIDGVVIIQPPDWRLSGVDFDVNGTVDGDSGAVQFSTQAHDSKAPLASLIAQLPHFPPSVFHDPGRLSTEMKTLPFDVRVVVPERGLGSFPAILRQGYLTGRVKAELHASGTMTTPQVDLAAQVTRSRFSGQGRNLALDLALSGHYDGAKGKVKLGATSEGRSLLDMEADVDAQVAQFLEPASRAPAWSGGAQAHFAGFPLSAITALNDKLVAGELTGDVVVADLHRNGHATASFKIDALTVGSVAFKDAKLDAKVDDKLLTADVLAEQSDGSFETKVSAPSSWGTSLAPYLDNDQPLDVALVSKNFRVSVLMPFVEGTLDELDGRLEADAHVQLDARTRAAHLSGSMALRQGIVEATAGGGELHDVTATIHFNPDGTITVDRMSADGMTGHLEATAEAKLDGMALQSAKAKVAIPEDRAVPLTAGGAEIGNVNGDVELTASSQNGGKSLAVAVSVPNVRVALPEGVSNSVQGLGPMNDVRIGAHRGSKNTFILTPLTVVRTPSTPADDSASDASKTAMDVNLGDVEVVRGTQLKVDLTGKLKILSGAQSEVTGQIRLKRGGVVNLQGKNFEIENGTITMTKDASNPEIVLRAGWTAPDGTVVYADFVGPLKTGKVTLSAAPTLTQQEIVQLLLFGTVDGPQAQQPQASTQNSAIATAGGEAAQPLNHALNQLGLGAVTANIDTSQSSNPKPEVEVQIARGISIEIAYVLGIPPPGVNPDSTLLTVNWRFLSRWSLASTLGDKGTTIFDLLWKKRY